ncbi:MAG: efflux RND transporter periplasmic adaptor subunit [Ferruginibacter sp.]
MNRVHRVTQLGIFCFLSISILSCSSGDKKTTDTGAAKKPQVSKAEGFIVIASPLTQEIEVPGSLEPSEETTIQPEISGRVISINFREGTPVSKGAVLIKLYDADLQAQLKKLQVQLSIAKKTEERQQQLLNINGISQQDYDLSLLAVRNLEADIEIIQTSISKTVIKAPFSGVLGLRNISLGAYINPTTIITTLRETAQLALTFTIPERYGNKLKMGALVQFSVDGDGQMYPATIVASENNIAEDTRSLKMKAVVQKGSHQLIAGAFAKVKIALGKNETALMVPTQAIIPQARGKKVMVNRAGLAVLQAVTTGVRDSSLVEITSGLKIGDTIMISGLMSTKPGTKLNLTIASPKNKQ